MSVDLPDRVIVRCQILGISGEQIATLAGFRVQQGRFRLLQLRKNLAGVNHPPLIGGLYAKPAVDHERIADEQQNQEGKADNDTELSNKSLHRGLQSASAERAQKS